MRVLFFANLKEVAGVAETVIEVSGSVDIDSLWLLLLARYPRLIKYRSIVRVARNCEYVDSGTLFENGDEVALIPPVSGG